EALPALEALLAAHQNKGANQLAMREAVWALIRIADASARPLVRRALKSEDETVRQAALHGISRWRDQGATDLLLDVLKKGTPHNRRAAAEALGRAYAPMNRKQEGSKEWVPTATIVSAIIEALAQPNDHTLHHSLTYAL